MRAKKKYPEKKFDSQVVVKFNDAFMHINNNIYQKEIEDSFFLKDCFYWQQLRKRFPNIEINKLFKSVPQKKIKALMNKAQILDSSYKPVNLLTYYSVTCPESSSLDEMTEALRKWPEVELAYIYGRSFNSSINTNTAPAVLMQGYLNGAPQGIDAKYAWKFNGGGGKGTVKLIDIEQGWHLHPEIMNIKKLPLTGIIDDFSSDHGFAVLAVIMMKENISGTIGICPDASGHIISQWRPDGLPNDADALMTAIFYLHYGDIILLESQSYCYNTSNKLWPVEIQDACFDVIRLATALGIIVIEAAANGDLGNGEGNDLNLFTLYKKRIFCPGSVDFRDSGAVMVAAAIPYVPHTRLRYSNYGTRINCYAWGTGVSIKENYSIKENDEMIVRKLNGTSAAAAIIAGTAVIVQSICEAKYNTRLSAKQMRNVLGNAEFGTTSANGNDKDKIGVMPDLKKIIDNFLSMNPANIQ